MVYALDDNVFWIGRDKIIGFGGIFSLEVKKLSTPYTTFGSTFL
jgi:hypothetical protein